MPFTVKEFPGQRFESIEEYREAREKRIIIEQRLATQVAEATPNSLPTRVTAVIVPAPPDLVSRKVAELEMEVRRLGDFISALPKDKRASENEAGLSVGTVLQGESQGTRYTLEVLVDGYLCSDGKIYDSLSGAALGVSGNRRSGWKFWKTAKGTPLGEETGRFSGHVNHAAAGKT